MADETRISPLPVRLRDRLGPAAYTVTLLTVVFTFAALGATLSVMQTRTPVPSFIPFLSPPTPQHFPATGSIKESEGVSPPAPSSVIEEAPSNSSSAIAELAECKALWDSRTHMTKRQWEAACDRAKP